MSEFPIILFPPAIARIQAELPPIAKLPHPPPEPLHPQPIGAAPQRVEWKIIVSITLTVTLVTLIFGAIIARVAPGLADEIKLLIGFTIPGAIVGGLLSQSLSFTKRRQKHNQKKQQFFLEERRYEQAKAYFPERQRLYKTALETYHQRHEQLKAECLTPGKIAKMRQAKYLSILQHTRPYDGRGSTTKAGSSEALLGKVLALYFADRIQTHLTLNMPNSEDVYVPDFIYLDKTTGLHIDIEVDEPYSHKSGNPIHYQGKDDRRNEFICSKGWVVVRFSERQVVLSPRRCCKTIALIIAELTGDTSVLQTLTNIPDLDPMPQWTYEEALAMASEGKRDQYQPVKKSVKERSPHHLIEHSSARNRPRAKRRD